MQRRPFKFWDKKTKALVSAALAAGLILCPAFCKEACSKESDPPQKKAKAQRPDRTFEVLSKRPIDGDTLIAISNDSENMISWRKFAEQRLKEDKNSPEGNAVMGMVYYCAEGDLPRARHYLEKAGKAVMKKARSGIGGSRMVNLYAGIQIELMHILGEMDAYDDKVKTVDAFVKILPGLRYLEVEKAWPLMKLGREEEARKVIDKAANSGNLNARYVALNTLGALEADLGSYQSAYNSYYNLISEVKRNGEEPEPTFLRNLGEVALCLGRYDEAERCFIQAAHSSFSDVNYSNPYSDLTKLYIEEARFTDAASSLKKTLQWSQALRPFLYQQHMAEDTQLTAVLMLELGYIPEAAARQKVLLGRPDRQGGSSITKEQAESGNLLTWYAIIHALRESCREQLSWETGLNKWKLRLKILNITYQMWRTSNRIRAILAQTDSIIPSLRPFCSKGIQVSECYRSFLPQILGGGTCAAALEDLTEHAPVNYPVEEPYIILRKADTAYSIGNKKSAYKNFLKAKETLPKSAAMLRYFAQAKTAQLQNSYAETATHSYLEDYTKVLQNAPMVFRHQELSIPVIVSGQSGSALNKFKDMIDDSPRFECRRNGSEAFTLTFGLSQNRLTSRLSFNGTVISNSSVKLTENTDKSIANLVKEVHNQTFSTKVSLSSLGLDSIDGANISGSTAREQFDEVFDKSGDSEFELF